MDFSGVRISFRTGAEGEQAGFLEDHACYATLLCSSATRDASHTTPFSLPSTSGLHTFLHATPTPAIAFVVQNGSNMQPGTQAQSNTLKKRTQAGSPSQN